MSKTKVSKSALPDDQAPVSAELRVGEDCVEAINWQELEGDLRSGDEEAITYVVNRLHGRLLERAEHVLFDCSMAEVVVNAALLCALSKIAHGHPIYDWERFFFAQVWYKAQDQNKKTRNQRRREGVSLDQSSADRDGSSWANGVVDEHAETPLENLLRRETIELIRALVPRLPIALQEVVQLRFVEELKFREVSDCLGIPIPTVAGHLHRAIAMLRGWLEEEDDASGE